MSRNNILIISVLGILLIASGCSGGGGGGSTTTTTTTTLPSGPPTTPTGVSAQVVSTTQINLSWSASTDNGSVAGYYVLSDSTPAFALSTSYSATGLSAGTEHCFAVAAIDNEGNISNHSAAVCATTQATASPWSKLHSGSSYDLSNVVWTGSSLITNEDVSFGSASVLSSATGVTWARHATASMAFRGAVDMVYGDNKIVAVDKWQQFYISPDGISWQSTYTETGTSDVFGLAWSPTLKRYVAVGNNGFISTSDDGITWSAVTPVPTTAPLYGVAWLNDHFFAVGYQGVLLTSVDGRNWVTKTASGTTSELTSVAWNGKTGVDALYVAAGYVTSMTSSDGDNWTVAANSPLGLTNEVAWGGGTANLFVAVAMSNQIMTSPDGVNWTQRFPAAATHTAQLALNDVVWTGTRFVAVGGTGTILVSENGLDWRIVEDGSALRSVTHDGSRFISVGDHGRMAVSNDAATWEFRHTGDDSYYWRDITWNGSLYLLSGQDYTLTSSDLINWNEHWEGAASVRTSALWDGGRFVRAGVSLMSWDGTSLLSGTTDPLWNWSCFNNTTLFNDIYWDGTTYVAVGITGTIYTSPDAANDINTNCAPWTQRSSGTAKYLYGVTKGNGRFVAVGEGGTILTSDDSGVTWLTRTSNITDTLNAITWTGSKFIAVGNYGRILTSTDGASWTNTQVGTAALYNVYSQGTTTVIVGASGTLIRGTP